MACILIVYNDGGEIRVKTRWLMDWLIPVLAASGFFILWVFVLSRFKGGT